MSKILWIVCGVPGSGKSTWIREYVKKTGGIHCSRDEVRFSMLSEDEDYFAHEDEVWCAWIKQIKENLENPEVSEIFADATHLNDRARTKLINEIFPYEFETRYLVFTTPLDVCLERNENRTGRAYVPRSVIRRMHSCFTIPIGENVWYVNEKGELKHE